MRLRNMDIEGLNGAFVQKVRQQADNEDGPAIVTVMMLQGAGPYVKGDELDVYPYQLEEVMQ